MKKILLILIFSILLTSCLDRDKTYKLTILTKLSNDSIDTKTKEIMARNDVKAYYNALIDILPNFRYDNNGKYEQNENNILSFTLLDAKNNNIAEKLSEKVKDSLLKLSLEDNENLLKVLNKPRIVAKEDIENLLSDWNGSLPSLVEYVKKNLHNPDSFEHVETGYIDKGEYILIKMIYSAENGFGAIRKASISAKVDYNGEIIEILN